jgi:hypothetical protein
MDALNSLGIDIYEVSFSRLRDYFVQGLVKTDMMLSSDRIEY